MLCQPYEPYPQDWKGVRPTAKQLELALKLHGKWLRDEEGGLCLSMHGADLNGQDLACANLEYADFTGANLANTNLRFSFLHGAIFLDARLYRPLIGGAKGIAEFGPCPLSGEMIYAVEHDDDIMWRYSDFWGTSSQMVERCPDWSYYSSMRGWYRAIIDAAVVQFEAREIVSQGHQA